MPSAQVWGWPWPFYPSCRTLFPRASQMHRGDQNEARMTAPQMKGAGQMMVSDYKNHLRSQDAKNSAWLLLLCTEPQRSGNWFEYQHAEFKTDRGRLSKQKDVPACCRSPSLWRSQKKSGFYHRLQWMISKTPSSAETTSPPNFSNSSWQRKGSPRLRLSGVPHTIFYSFLWCWRGSGDARPDRLQEETRSKPLRCPISLQQ